jgi:hypothetical protein
MGGGGIARRGRGGLRRGAWGVRWIGAFVLACLVSPARADDHTTRDRAVEAVDEEEAREPWPGYTLADAWDAMWVRIMARGGRPDPDGPLLQRFSSRMGPRYQLDVYTPEFPMASEQRWAEQPIGVRMWVRSLDALDLGMRLQLRTEIPTWSDGYLGLQYDERQDWITELRTLRFEVGHRDIAGRGLDAALRVYPRFDKNDIDVEAITGARVQGLGEARLRLGAVDPFINATFGALEYKGFVLEEHIWHVDLPLATSLDLRTDTFAGVRAELYAGYLMPQRRRHRFPDQPDLDHLRFREARLGAALLEWRVPRTDVAVGATVQGIDARMAWEYGAVDGDEASDIVAVRERTVSAKGYALANPLSELHLQLAFGYTARPESWSAEADATERDDREWMWSVRTLWMPTRVVGADLQYIGAARTTEGPPDLPVDGHANTLITRIMLDLGNNVWTSFGFGWGLDSNSPYDRGSMTLIWTPE